MLKILKKVVATFAIILLFFAMVWAFQQIWNVTMPAIFSIKTITYLQALGLLALSRMLFGGFGFRWMNMSAGKHFWYNHTEKKNLNLSEEEKQHIRNKCR